jgi:hypothetical protein
MKAVQNRRFALGAFLAAVVLATAGCGGFNGTYSASPATLFLQNRHVPAPEPQSGGDTESPAAVRTTAASDVTFR